MMIVLQQISSIEIHSIWFIFLVTSLPSGMNNCNLCERSFAKRQILYRILRTILKVYAVNFGGKMYSKWNWMFFFKPHEKVYERNVIYWLTKTRSPCEHEPNNSALQGTVESFFLKSQDHFDFLQFIVEVKPVEEEIGNESVNTEPLRVELSVIVVIEKPSVNEKEEKRSNHVNLEIEFVFFVEGLADEIFWRRLDQLLSFFSFSLLIEMVGKLT